MRNHAKTDRVFDLAARKRLPVVLFAEGGGGRPGDTDVGGHAGLDVPTFRVLAGLSGRVPLVSIVSGRCFAGNAALAGVCDVIIATPDANIGMGGPAMIEGGGLGVYPPEAIGPIDVQRHNGVVHLVARDEAHAVVVGQAVSVVFSGELAGQGRLGSPGSAAGPTCGAAEPVTRLRRAPGDRVDRRRRLRAGTAPRLRGRDRHRAGSRRGRGIRADCQQQSPSRRRDRRRGGRQGRRLPRPVRSRSGCR